MSGNDHRGEGTTRAPRNETVLSSLDDQAEPECELRSIEPGDGNPKHQPEDGNLKHQPEDGDLKHEQFRPARE